ncbi:MAG: hypothetical protein ABIJ45_01960 [Candidatus Zixiibacteriota bacterium]
MNELIQQALVQIGEPGGFFDSAKMFVEERFGTAGLVAAGLLIAAILGLILSKAVKMSFDVVRYVAVPAVAVSFIGTYFLPYSFVYILPVTVAFFSIILIIKG